MNKALKITGGRSYYDEVTFLRGFSILTIVLMHFIQNDSLPGIVNKILSIGGTGVHVFFFCSGFGLFLSYLKKPLKYTEFLKKRFFKVYIPYIVVVSISALLPYMYDGNRLGAWLSHVFLYKMFIPVYEESFGPFWFISTLFQFYFLFVPMVRLKENIGPKKWFVGCSSLSITWWVFTAITGLSDQRIWGSFFLQYLWEFALGIVIAEYLKSGKSITIKTKWLVVIGIIGIGIAGVAKVVGGYFTAFNDIFATFGYGAIALFIYVMGCTAFNKFISFTSKISYELYLVHMLVFCTIRLFVPSYAFSIILAIIVSYVIAYGYQRLIKNKKVLCCEQHSI